MKKITATAETEPMAICKAALLALDCPEWAVEKLKPGVITDSIVQMMVFDKMTWNQVCIKFEEAKKEYPQWKAPWED